MKALRKPLGYPFLNKFWNQIYCQLRDQTPGNVWNKLWTHNGTRLRGRLTNNRLTRRRQPGPLTVNTPAKTHSVTATR